jgi:WD40 repeat protein
MSGTPVPSGERRKRGILLALLAIGTVATAQSHDKPLAGTIEHLRDLGQARLTCGSPITHALVLHEPNQLLTTTTDGITHLWDLKTRREIRRFVEESDSYAWDVVAIPGKDQILVASYGGWVSRWDLKTGKRLARYETTSKPVRLALGPGAKRFAVGGTSGLCEIWDLETGKKVRAMEGMGDTSIYSLTFTCGGDFLVTGGTDGVVRRWDPETGKAEILLAPPKKKNEQGQLEPDNEKGPGTIQTLCPGPGENEVLVCTTRQSLQLWNVRKKRAVWTSDAAKAGTDIVRSVVSPDRTRIAAISDSDDKLLLIDPRNGKILRTIDPKPGGANFWAAAFSPDGSEVFCGIGYCMAAFDVKSGQRTFPAHDRPLRFSGICGLDAMPDGRSVAAVARDGLWVQDVQTGRVIRRYLQETGLLAMDVAAGSPDIAVLTDSHVRVFRDKDEAVVISLNDEGAIGMAASPDGTTVATWSRYGEAITFLSARTGKAVNTVTVGEDVDTAVVTPSGAQLAVLSEQNVVLLDLAGGGLLASYSMGLSESHPLYGGSRKLALLGKPVEGLLLASENAVYLFDRKFAKTGRLPPGRVRRLAAQLSSRSWRERKDATDALIQGGSDVLIHLAKIQPEDPEQLSRVRGIIREILKRRWQFKPADMRGLGQIQSLTGHPDGRHWVAVVGRQNEGKLVLGTAINGQLQEVATFTNPNLPEHFCFLPDGTMLTGNANGTISVYRIALGKPKD